MKLHPTALAAAFAASILTPCLAFGAGYGIYEQGAAVLGMAGAATASVNDASANYYNPAALTTLHGTQLYVGGTWLTTHTSFAGTAPWPGYGITEEMNTGNFFPPTFYLSHQFGTKWAAGVGVNAPFGLGVDWKKPDSFTDRAYVTKADLRSINANVNLAYQVTPELSIAAGYDAIFAGVELNRISSSPTSVIPGGGGAPIQSRVHLKGGYTSAYTENFAALWSPEKDWKFGLNYRGKASVKIDNGTADFALVPTGSAIVDAAATPKLPPSQAVSTTLTFPSLLSVAAAWNPVPEWTWELDVNRTGWSAFKELALAFNKSPELNTSVTEDYKDSYRLSVGAEHRLKCCTYRFGYYFDQAAAPTQSVTTLLPDANRHGATLGLSWVRGASKQWTIDLYNMALFVEDRSTEKQNSHGFDGTYKSYVNACGASLAYRW
jgi:long-chain fatty acid transport protein